MSEAESESESESESETESESEAETESEPASESETASETASDLGKNPATELQAARLPSSRPPVQSGRGAGAGAPGGSFVGLAIVPPCSAASRPSAEFAVLAMLGCACAWLRAANSASLREP